MTIKSAKESRAAKAKGREFENAVADLYRRNGFPNADRAAKHGTKDIGDIYGVHGLTIEAKNQTKLNLAKWHKELEVEREGGWGIVIHKTKGIAAADGSRTSMPSWMFAQLWNWCVTNGILDSMPEPINP